jgi:hypothetical protein
MDKEIPFPGLKPRGRKVKTYTHVMPDKECMELYFHVFPCPYGGR